MQKRTTHVNAGAPAATAESAGESAMQRQALRSAPTGPCGGSHAGPPLSAQQSAVPQSHGVLGIPGSVPGTRAISGISGAGPSKRQRKERLPNWGVLEVLALVEAKRILNLEETDSRDGRDLMTPDTGKWQRISADVMQAGQSTYLRDGPSCKSKWNQLIPDYKRLIDFFSRTGTNEACYWTMDTQEKKKEGLPKSFAEDVYHRIHEWYGTRPAVLPLHTRDALSGDDINFEAAALGPAVAPEEVMSAEVDEENFESEFHMEDSDDFSPSTKSASAAREQCRVLRGKALLSPQSSTPAPIKSCMLAGMTPQLISSSDTPDAQVRRRLPNTGIRRKNVSGHSLIAEATRASGDAMSGQLREIAQASRELEQCKLEVQMKCFAEQMQYQRDRDRRLHESAKQANENAKLSIEKQSEVVQCLAQLASVLSSGLHTRDTAAVKSSSAFLDRGDVASREHFQSAIPSQADPALQSPEDVNMEGL